MRLNADACGTLSRTNAEGSFVGRVVPPVQQDPGTEQSIFVASVGHIPALLFRDRCHSKVSLVHRCAVARNGDDV